MCWAERIVGAFVVQGPPSLPPTRGGCGHATGEGGGTWCRPHPAVTGVGDGVATGVVTGSFLLYRDKRVLV